MSRPDAIAVLDAVLTRARDLRRSESYGQLIDGEDDAQRHRRALNAMQAAAADVCTSEPSSCRRLMTACKRVVNTLAAPRTKGELVALMAAGDVLEHALRIELATLRRRAA